MENQYVSHKWFHSNIGTDVKNFVEYNFILKNSRVYQTLKQMVYLQNC
jgi:hypothetical protein